MAVCGYLFACHSPSCHNFTPSPCPQARKRKSLSFTKNIIRHSNFCRMSIRATHSHDEEISFTDCDFNEFARIANKIADVSGEVIRKYFRKKVEIMHKPDLSPVTIADKVADESMGLVVLENFSSHAVFGEESGWRSKKEDPDFVWVLDPIDGTKSFITGKPLFGTLIALLWKNKPILGIIDQPILRERWLGIWGRSTTLNGEVVSTRACKELARAYLYTTSPQLFNRDAKEAFSRVSDKVKSTLYGCDCYAYALLASGFVDLVIEASLKPYDFLALIPVIQGAGGMITDWGGHDLHWEASPHSINSTFDVVAAGDKAVHGQALDSLRRS